jgi:hypothetical protein
MEITLLRTGGIIPIQKKAQEEVAWCENEIEELISCIKTEDDAPGKMRDHHQYQLVYNGQSFSIDIGKVPSKYKDVFERLRDNLQIVKPG